MATQEKTWNVANRLHSLKDSNNPEVNHIIAGADEIYDDAKGAKQSDINAQTGAALANRYTKAETYSKEQLNSLITTPDVNYVTVATFADLPQTGESDTVYRVSSYDGTQVDVTKYALYAWDGTTYQLLAVRSAIGEVVDVSEINSGATYVDLPAALAAVPASVQRGGMSVKFIQRTNTGTEDEPVYNDEYVQYRYMGTSIATADFTNTANWQGVDDEPTAGSRNLVESGGIAEVYGKYKDDEEWVYALTDRTGKIIVGVTTDGTIEWYSGVPSPIKEYIGGIVSNIVERIDVELNNKVDKIDGKGLSTNDYLDDEKEIVETMSLNESAEYLQMITDANGTIIEGIKFDGEKVILTPLRVTKLITGAHEQYADNIEEWYEIHTDATGKIIYGVKSNGDFVFGTGIPSTIKGYIDAINSVVTQNSKDIEELKSGNTGNSNKPIKVIKSGSYIDVRTKLSNYKDILIRLKYHSLDNHINFECFYVGSNELDDTEIASSDYLVRNISDSIGAIGIDTFWFLYAQHGWTIPRMNVANQTLTTADIGSIWADQNGHRFIIGNISGNYIYLLPELTLNETTGVYSASWKGSLTYPTELTHISGATHTSSISGTSSRYDLRIQTVASQKLFADNKEITDNGTYYCDEFIIAENILGHSVGDTKSWFPQPVYGESLINWDRTYIFNGSMCTFNIVMNVVNPFVLTDYRGQIIQMPLQVGDYHSYTFIPKIKKLVNGHRVDLPFNSDDGAVSPNYVSATRDATDLYDVNDQPDRCINYLKDDNDDYLVGMAGGCSLIRGLSIPSKRNAYVPAGQNTCTYGGSSTLNKFYPKILQGAGFTDGIVDGSFIDEFCSYYCWFDPNENDGQVYYYKDGDKYILYIHNQQAHDKLSINLPDFMDGMIVESVIEKTAGSTLLTEQVVGGRLYVRFDTTTDSANYIVLVIN